MSQQLIGEASLRRADSEFMAHYHEERNRHSLDDEVIMPLTNVGAVQGSIPRKTGLRGMRNCHYCLRPN